MALISFPNTFANIIAPTGAQLDANFAAINTAFASATGVSATPGVNIIPITDGTFGVLIGFTRQPVIGNTGGNAFSFGTTQYVGLDNYGGASTVEAAQQTLMGVAGTIRALYAKAQTNTVNGNIVVTLRQNGAGTALTTTITSSSTAVFNDTTHSVNFVAGDLLDWQLAIAGSSGSVTTVLLACLVTI